MEIKVKMEATIELKEGETNINEILYAIGNLSRRIYLDASKGVIESYQREVIKILCAGEGKSSWVKHEEKGTHGQMCIGGNFKSAGTRPKERIIRTDRGNINIKMQQIKCGICGKRFGVLLPLLKIPPRAKPTVKLKHMMAETVTDLSYRKGSSRIEGLAEVIIPKSTLHRWMTTENWEILQDATLTESNWKSFLGILADGTGYKRQKGETTRGLFRIVMGVSRPPNKLIPLGVWADKSWKEINEELNKKRPEGVKVPVGVVDGQESDTMLEGLVDSIQRCQWHLSNQLGYALWEDKAPKALRDSFVSELAGIIKIELPKEDYKEIPPEMQTDIEKKLKESKESIEKLIESFYEKGYLQASNYLKNALGHIFTVVEKWLQLGYMPPKVISLLERVMREMGRRIKKIGASWKEKGLIAVAHVLLTRIYTPQAWNQYWTKLLDIQDRCIVRDYHISFSIIRSCTIPGHY